MKNDEKRQQIEELENELQGAKTQFDRAMTARAQEHEHNKRALLKKVKDYICQ